MSTLQKTDMNSTTKILQASIRLFAEKGVESTSIRDIAELAGVNPSLVSYHFGSKKGLFRSVMLEVGKSELELLNRIIEPCSNVEEFKLRLKMLLDELVELHHRRPEMNAILNYYFMQADEKSSEIFDSLYMTMYFRMVDFFKSAQESGFARTQLSAVNVVNILVGGVTDSYRMKQLHKMRIGIDYDLEEDRRKLKDTIYELCVGGFVG